MRSRKVLPRIPNLQNNLAAIGICLERSKCTIKLINIEGSPQPVSIGAMIGIAVSGVLLEIAVKIIYE